MGTATAPSAIWNPAAVAQLAYEQVFDTINLLRSGYIADARATAIRDEASGTIYFPYAEDVAENLGVQTNPQDGTPVVSDKTKIAFEDVTTLPKILSFENDAKALAKIQRFTSPDQFMARLVMNKMQKGIQNSLVTTANTTTLSFTDNQPTATVSQIKRALIETYGDKAAELPPLVVLHSRCAWDIEQSEEVQKLGVYGNILRPGAITNVAGINFMMNDSVTVTGTGQSATYTNLIILPDAVELWMEQTMAYGEQRIPRTTAWVSDWWWEYATHLARGVISNKRGVVKYIVTATIPAT